MVPPSYSIRYKGVIIAVCFYLYLGGCLFESVSSDVSQLPGSTCVCKRLGGGFQAFTYTREQVTEMMEFLIESGPPHLHWEPVEVFCKLSCVPLMLQLISTACDWGTYYGRYSDRTNQERCLRCCCCSSVSVSGSDLHRVLTVSDQERHRPLRLGYLGHLDSGS